MFKSNSIILSTTATIGKHALVTTDFLCNQQFTNFDLKNEYKEKLNPKFVNYYFFIIDNWCLSNINCSAFPSVKIANLKKYLFPIPPIEIQNKIVEILDKFSDYINNLSSGLPKEIELLKQQYEYYRNKLLSF